MLDAASMATTVGPNLTASTPSSSSFSSAALFTTDITNNVVELKNVILNEFHVLRKFLLISLCERALRVTLDSDLGSQVGFQLNNENIDNADGSRDSEPTVASFLADDFSELFNTVNLVKEVILQPKQIQQVIITFRPWELSEDAPNHAREFEEGRCNIQVSSDHKIYENPSVEPSSRDVYPRANQTFKVNGRIFLSARILADEAETWLGSVDETSMDQRQDIVVHFYSTVCRSILRADVPDIVFDDCVPGGVFVKDFSVWNLSEIPCAFHIHVKNGRAEQPPLDLTDYDTELPVTSGEIKSCAHRRMRVMYKPRDVGEFSYTIHLENSFDVRNSTCIPIHCIVTAEHRQEGLLVTGVGEDGILDFGDCYSNNGTCQMMTLRNITHEAFVVNLGTDHPAGDQVNFYLQSELDLSTASTTGFMPFIKPQESSRIEVGNSSARLTNKLGDSLGSSVNFDKNCRVEGLTLERGEEKNLLVWYFAAGASDESKAARLQRRTFRVSLKCAEKKGRSKQRFSNIIQCKARICTSIVKLSTPELNFGDCNIGSTKSATFEIINLSDLPALVTSCVTSTILSFKNKAERVLIPPRQSYSLDIDLVPLKINPKYRKQITIDNFYNKDNQQVLEVRAKITDRHHVLLHSLYYKLRTPSTNNFLNFDCVIVNNPSIRTLAVENITDRCLTLGFSTSMPEELGIYQLHDDSQSELGDDTDSVLSDGSEEDDHESRRRAYAASVNKEKLLETLEESQPRLSKAIVDSAPFPVQQGHKKSIPPRPRFPATERKTRMRMSLDLATSSFIDNGGDKAVGLASSLPGSSAENGEAKKELLVDVKPFGVPTEEHAPRPLKRVQSSAMLSAIEEAPNVASENCQEEVSTEGIEEVLKRLGNHVISHCSFSDEEAEKQYVENQIKDRELLMHVLEDLARTLTPVRKLELLPGETRTLYVLLTVDGQTRPSLQGRLQKLTAKVNIQLLDYDREWQQFLEAGSLEQPVDEDLLTRELPVHFKACRGFISLAQKNISFGKLLTNEHRAKTLVLNNISDVPLLYKLKKTGSIASGDLHIINGRMGILRPHSDREINFVFQPSLGGSFRETLIVGNVYDPSNDQVVTLKATISRADTFWLNTSSIDFGTVVVGEWSKPQSVVIVNNSKQSRTYILKAADYMFDEKATKSKLDGTSEASLPVLRFMLEEKRKRSPQGAVAPEEEAIEALERKGIALERKGKRDKAAKIRNQVIELRSRVGSPIFKATDNVIIAGSKEDKNNISGMDMHPSHGGGRIGDKNADLPGSNRNTSLRKGSDGYISLALEGGDSKVVFVSILVSPSSTYHVAQRVGGTLVAYESKNQDVVKKIYFEVTTLQQAPNQDPSGAVLLDPLDPKLQTISRESPCYPLVTQSPSLSPNSSAPTSPCAYTPKSVTAQDPSRGSSPELSSTTLSSSQRKNVLASEVENVSSESCNLPGSFSQVKMEGWGSKQHILEWGKAEEELASVDDAFEGVAADGDESSRSGSCSGLFVFDPLFKVDLLGPPHNQGAGLVKERDGDVNDDVVMDLSSAAALARSLASHKIQELGKALFAGELILDDASDHISREASFLLKSQSPRDIWVQFHLAWDGKPDVVQLWVNNDGPHADNGSLVDLSPPRTPRQLHWEKPECSENLGTDDGIFVSSFFLKGGSVSTVTLIRPDETLCESWRGSDLSRGVTIPAIHDSKVQATGVLTMQARPDDGLSQQVLVRVKHLETCIKVTPSEIVFPESELNTILRQDLIIKNRTGTPLTYQIGVTGVSRSPTATTLVENKNKLPSSTAGAAECLRRPSNEVPEMLLAASSDPIVSVYPVSGHIGGHESINIKVTCRPLKPGKRSQTINIQTSSCFRETQVGVTVVAAKAHYLHLPDLPDGATLDMGFCFINSLSGEKVVPLRLQNLGSDMLLLSFRSNLAKQVYVSTTSKSTKRTDDLELPGGASLTVYMCLRPGGDAAAFEGGQCRKIIGGMRISVREILAGNANEVGETGGASQEKFVDEIMVKFQAIVGKSLLQVSAAMIDFGRVREIGGCVVGDFLISNPSSQMPLHFSLISKQAQLVVSEGHLVGKDVARLSGGSLRSEMTVKFSLPVSVCGLIEDSIVVQNISCIGQNAEVVLRLFVDGGIIEAYPEPSLPHFQHQQAKKVAPLPGPDLPPIGSSKSGVLSGRSSSIVKSNGHIVQVASAREAGSRVPPDRKIRKASSAGDFFFASLTLSDGTADGSNQGHELTLDSYRSHDTVPLQSNPCLDLGTVFVSPDSRRNFVSGSVVIEDADISIYCISDLRPYHCSLLIKSLLPEAIELQPLSNLRILVDLEKSVITSYQMKKQGASSVHVSEDMLSACNPYLYRVDAEMEAYCLTPIDATGFEELTKGVSCGLVTKLVSCGRPFVIQPFSTTRLFLSYLDPKQLSSSELARLSAGKMSIVEGLLVFIKGKCPTGVTDSDMVPCRHCELQDASMIHIGHQAVEVLNINGSICLSVGELVKKYVDLGKVGYANGWADVDFEITVENISDAVLLYQLVDVPECFSISLEELHTENNVIGKGGYVAPRGCSTLRVTLCTSKLEHVKQAGLCSWHICLLNCNNPKNLMELVVEAEMTVRTLRFGGLTEGSLLLPPLMLPALPSAPPCSLQFGVENLSKERLGVALQLHQAEETESLVMLEVVSQTNTTTGELTLEPGERVELRVCAHPISDIIPSHFVSSVPSRRTSRVSSGDALSGKDPVPQVPDISSSTEVLQADDTTEMLLDSDLVGIMRESQGSSELASTVCLGRLYLFSSPHLPDCIPIHGALLQGPSFDVSPHNIHLQAIMEEDLMGATWVKRHATAGSSQIFVIRNFRAFESLQFVIVANEDEEVIPGQSAFDFIFVQPLEGLILPRGSAEIIVKCKSWSPDDCQKVMNFAKSINLETLTITLVVEDAEGQESGRNLQRILINILPPIHIQEPVLEDAQTIPKSLSRNLSLSSVSKATSPLAQTFNRGPLVLGLRGCTPVGGNLLCYEVNLGQQNISSGGRLHWDLTLIGDPNRPINYRLSTISEGYASWLTISSSSGVVEAGQQKTVQLSFSTKAMGVYSTYLMVENLEYPADLKTVHLSLEVIAPRNARSEAPSLTFFHILVHGDRAEGAVIDMGEVYYNFWYRNRSLVIVNEAPVAMEFLLSSSMDQNELTELNFSLANTSLKRFSSVTVGAKSSVRIWIHFCPGPLKEKLITEDTDVMSANIFVNCRLVKDYRQCIPFRAKCRHPQIGISTTDLVFSTRREGQVVAMNWSHEKHANGVNGENDSENRCVNAPLIECAAVVGSTGAPAEQATYTGGCQSNGDLSGEELESILIAPAVGPRRDDELELLPPQQELRIRNLFLHRKLEYIVKNDSLYFVTDVPESRIIPSTSPSLEETDSVAQSNGSTQSFHVVMVKPNMESLLAHREIVLKQKYVEEHLTIYNRSNPREKYTVSLRITAGHLRNFFAAPGRKNSYPFNRLELLITSFLSSFYSLTSHILAEVAPAKSQMDLLQDMKLVRSNSKGGIGIKETLTKQNDAVCQGLEKWLESCISGQSIDYDSLFFDFHYLTDELVFYCLKEWWSRGGATLELATVQLAKLLYCALYRCQIFQVCLDSCQYFSCNVPAALALSPDHELIDDAVVIKPLYSGHSEVHAGESRLHSVTSGSECSDRPLVNLSPPKQCLKFLENWTGQLRHFLSFFPDSREDLIPLRVLSQKNQDTIIASRAALDRNQQFFLYRC